MKLLILSQVYWPDTASTAQHLADLAERMAARGHHVSVYASRRAYEAPEKIFPAYESRKGVTVNRLRQTGFSKNSILGRLINFLSFNLHLVCKLLHANTKNVDLVLGMTSPPLVSFFGVLAARWKGWKFCYWAMDLQPELAIQAGFLRQGSLAARGLDWMGRFIFKRADSIIALDRFMAEYIKGAGADAEKVKVARLWPVLESQWVGSRMDNPFRMSNGFGERLVVMYSGNHAVVHPLDTLLEAAWLLKEDDRFLFVFVGGGVRVRDVSDWKKTHELKNIIQLPYQPRSEIHVSLASADIHAVVMGDGQVGFTHPNKVYGAMAAGRAFLYIGPVPSHVSDIITECPGNLLVRHGEAGLLASLLMEWIGAGSQRWEEIGRRNAEWAERNMCVSQLIEETTRILEKTSQG